MSNDNIDYSPLANLEPGSAQFEIAMERIQKQERAAHAAREAAIQGDGRSGHAPASYTIVPPDAVPSNVGSYRGPMSQGVASPDLRTGLVKIGDMETNIEVGEAMRRSMSPQEWTSLTGLPYTSLTQAQYMAVGESNPTDLLTAGANAAKARDEAHLAEANEVDRLARENEEANKEAAEAEAAAWEPSLLETVMNQTMGPEVTNGLVKAVAELGEVTPDMAEQFGLNEEMLADVHAHYVKTADNLLSPIGSCSTYVENFATESEAKAFRTALVGRDIETVRRIGEAMKLRASAMSYNEVKQFLTNDEMVKLDLKLINRNPVVTLPKIGQVDWRSAVSNGWISFV
jgi:hypothetical protein